MAEKTTADLLQELILYKSDIKSAIEEKGQSTTGVGMDGYGDKIRAIEGGGGSCELEEITVSAQETEQVILPSVGKDGISQVTVEAASLEDITVTATVESQTISPSVGSYGISEVTVNPITLQDKTVSASGVDQTVSADSGFTGLGNVTVSAATLETIEVSPSLVEQIVTPSTDYYGISEVTINPIVLQAKSVTPTNVEQTVTPDENIDGLSQVTIAPIPEIELQNKTVTPSAIEQLITADVGFDGLNEVTVSAATLQNKSIIPSGDEQVVTADESFYGLESVTVNAVELEEITVTPSAGIQVITPSAGKVGISQVTVNSTSSPTGYTGNVDREGLAAIGYNEEQINWFQENSVNWMDYEDEYHLVSSKLLNDPNLHDIKCSSISFGADYVKGIKCNYLPAWYFDGYDPFNHDTLQDNPYLVSVYIPDGISQTGTELFYGCSSLSSVRLPNTIILDSFTFNKCALTSVDIHDNIDATRAAIFSDMPTLTSINVPAHWTEIPDGYIRNCTSITTTNIPEGITKIGLNAYNGCTGLTSIKIPSSVTEIGGVAFANCTSLRIVDLRELDSTYPVSFSGTPLFLGSINIQEIWVKESLLSQFQDLSVLAGFTDRLVPW